MPQYFQAVPECQYKIIVMVEVLSVDVAAKDECISGFQLTTEDLQQQLQKLQSERDALSSAAEESQQRIAALEQQCTELSKQTEFNRKQIRSLSADLSETQSVLAKTREELNTVKTEKDQVCEQLMDAQLQLEESKARIAAEQSAHEEHVREMESQRGALESELASSQKDIEVQREAATKALQVRLRESDESEEEDDAQSVTQGPPPPAPSGGPGMPPPPPMPGANNHDDSDESDESDDDK